MKKNLIKKFAEESFKGNYLNEAKIFEVLKILKREHFKIYLRYLKDLNSKKTVIITLSNSEGFPEVKKYFGKIYSDKKIVYNFDSSLLTGIKVVDYDNVYELSLRRFINDYLGSAVEK